MTLLLTPHATLQLCRLRTFSLIYANSLGIPASMSSQAGLLSIQAIDVLIAEKRRALEQIQRDLGALVRTREILAVSIANTHRAAVPGTAVPSQTADDEVRSWHSHVQKLFEDRSPHTTADVFDLARKVTPEIGYSAVASWLNRMAERGFLVKTGRGEFLLSAHVDVGGELANNEKEEGAEGKTELNLEKGKPQPVEQPLRRRVAVVGHTIIK